jgi:hypothetical protein
VRDIRRYINRHAPVEGDFHLQTLRPPQRLQSDQTIETAGLQMASVTIVKKE